MELTRNYALMVPLLAAAVAAHAFTVLFQKRSILTERLSRRGHHLSREYGVDPLEAMIVSQIMQSDIAVVPAESMSLDGLQLLDARENGRCVLVYDRAREQAGAVIAGFGIDEAEKSTEETDMQAPVVELVAFPGDTLRMLAERMATGHVSVIRVVEPGSGRLLGQVTLEDILLARIRSHERENRLERVRSLRLPFIGQRGEP